MPSGTNILRGTLAAGFIGAGVLHLVRPSLYLPIMPPMLPRPLDLIYISGVAEIVGGAGLLVPRVRRAAGIGLVALLVAVFPANVQMARNGFAAGASPLVLTLLLARLPLQPALMSLVLRCMPGAVASPAPPSRAHISRTKDDAL